MSSKKFDTIIDISMDKVKNYPVFMSGYLHEAIEFIENNHSILNSKKYPKSSTFYSDGTISSQLAKKYDHDPQYVFSSKFIRLSTDYNTPLFEVHILKRTDLDQCLS